MKRIVAAVLGALLGANGVAMLAAGHWWYALTPGVTDTGPYNPHFVMDIGAAYLVAAGALAWAAWRPVQAQAAVVAAASFLALHAFVHVFDAFDGAHAGASFLRDAPTIFLPAGLAVWIAWPQSRPSKGP